MNYIKFNKAYRSQDKSIKSHMTKVNAFIASYLNYTNTLSLSPSLTVPTTHYIPMIYTIC